MNIQISKKHRSWIIGIAIIFAVAVICVWAAARSTTQFETTPIARGNIESKVIAIGTLQPLNSVEVGAQVSGQITRIYVHPGDEVKKSQLLAEIDASVLRATVEAGLAQQADLQAQLAEQRALHGLAVLQNTRQQKMLADDATRLEDVQTAEAELAAATARVNQLKARILQIQSNLKADQARLGYARIYAPMTGTVTGIDAKEGQTLNATYQIPTLLRIADLSKMTVWTTVSEADIRRVKAGQQASFTTLAGDRRRWNGVVRQVLPSPPQVTQNQSGNAQPAVSKVVQYVVLFDVDNNDAALLPQMTAQVSFVTASARDVPVAPLAALQPIDEKPHMYRARVLDASNQPQLREVRGGVQDRMSVQIIDGLREGERLITGETETQTGPRRLRW